MPTARAVHTHPSYTHKNIIRSTRYIEIYSQNEHGFGYSVVFVYTHINSIRAWYIFFFLSLFSLSLIQCGCTLVRFLRSCTRYIHSIYELIHAIVFLTINKYTLCRSVSVCTISRHLLLCVYSLYLHIFFYILSSTVSRPLLAYTFDFFFRFFPTFIYTCCIWWVCYESEREFSRCLSVDFVTILYVRVCHSAVCFNSIVIEVLYALPINKLLLCAIACVSVDVSYREYFFFILNINSVGFVCGFFISRFPSRCVCMCLTVAI